ncbi:hypothetical protein [Saccharopolyspora spinosa]|uniref:Secreted protein with PEP-CTERM sorting signal n=1 Tax=Saccharopolyspora spinosa TaxID=60894 RepID=A0A2N3XPU6_SACSN|nr:hypothetical protein [Saccharopolyspora spinosa]PKW12704.1 hypothetical protein A8926_0180 [Saccharopolyspora spinosa]
MRSRISRVVTRVSVLGPAFAAVLLATAGVAAAADSTVLAGSPLESLSAPVGLTAVALGVAGMVAGMFRKKKIQPENQRKT